MAPKSKNKGDTRIGNINLFKQDTILLRIIIIILLLIIIILLRIIILRNLKLP